MADPTPTPPGSGPHVQPGLPPGATPPPPPPPPGAVSATPLNLPPIPLSGSPPPPAAAPTVAARKPDAEVKDSFRELIETIVFVVVLVLMLKTFLAEAFVIPTGSMAKTLLGYHYKVTCKECGYVNWVNASKEAEYTGKPENRPQLERCMCENCQFINEVRGRQPAPPRVPN